MGDAKLGQWLNLLVCVLILLKAEGGSVGITYLESAVAKGAVCLDGSAPAYHFDKGSGSGANNWVVHMEGGGWCNNVETCLDRKTTDLGSSKKMDKSFGFSGILGSKQSSNPDFFNWNRIKVRYCDGSSFTGDAFDPANKLYFRGARVWQAIMDDLMAKGMRNAQNAILSGCSAGGLASILNCDRFRSLFPATTKVKCIADAGFFLNAKDVSGGSHIGTFYSQVVATHGSAKNLPASCTSRMRPELCFFPQNVVPFMQTPIFFINSGYDSWQIKNILAPSAADSKKEWKNCKLDFKKCSAPQLKIIQDYRTLFVSTITKAAGSSPARGMWIDSCYAHCQSGRQVTWSSDSSTLVAKTKIASAVGDWFHERGVVRKIDCPYPCNPTCQSSDSESNLPQDINA
ncbi:hypothetical protein SLEP1_g21875 [Rubroshorea leprosula]|uniref:Pectin acetylesterase n=1 Tax=Rubroshorea leprosula TaxID=152421 RepID=A0AAV5JHZ4_9ROSI|nr:hypothetical protein SLEP1_g21875 [Rubroshorea leprosula]